MKYNPVQLYIVLEEWSGTFFAFLVVPDVYNNFIYLQTESFRAPLVQLDRMSAYGADGRRFESCRECFFFKYREIYKER